MYLCSRGLSFTRILASPCMRLLFTRALFPKKVCIICSFALQIYNKINYKINACLLHAFNSLYILCIPCFVRPLSTSYKLDLTIWIIEYCPFIGGIVETSEFTPS